MRIIRHQNRKERNGPRRGHRYRDHLLLDFLFCMGHSPSVPRATRKGQQMKRSLQIVLLIVSGVLTIFIAGLWAWSYSAPHSLRYSRACGEIQAVTDRGIIQLDLILGDTKARGLEWDSHRRCVGWGRAELDMFRPKSGFAMPWADLGFATWSYTRSLQMFFGPNLPARVFFFPFWSVMLLPGCFCVWLLTLRRRSSVKTASGHSCTISNRGVIPVSLSSRQQHAL